MKRQSREVVQLGEEISGAKPSNVNVIENKLRSWAPGAPDGSVDAAVREVIKQELDTRLPTIQDALLDTVAKLTDELRRLQAKVEEQGGDLDEFATTMVAQLKKIKESIVQG